MSSIRSLVENKSKLDYKELTLSLVQEFGIKDKVEWDSVIPAQVQKELFGGETLRLFKDHETFANQKDIRAIHRSKGETSQLLILSAVLNDEKLSKQTIERITKKFVGGQATERYVVWFLGNPQQSAYKVVLSGKEGKKVVLKTLPFAVDQPYYKTYDFILNEVSSKVNKFFVEPNELWKSLWKAFDISVVNKKFYLDIKSAFDSLVNDDLFKGSIRIEEARKQFAVRLIGRIIFSWFLKKKGIISNDALSSKAVQKYDNYYLELLEKLFFGVFNTPQNERTKIPELVKEYPFLNGGLFEVQTGDYGDYQGKVFIDNDWFFSLFNNTLEKYNFTIDENTSSNSEIAIDPEMLGRIFENLLAEQNPETQESARKSTGSYYTPREIVDYMVEQSLIEYLKSNIGKDVILSEAKNLNLDQAIEDFVHAEELPEELKPYSKEILDKLSTVKILDPACGSGAFPIGMLQKLIALKLQLSPLTKGGTQGGSKEVYNLKLQTILNSIYGCDIQPMAVELSRLRCWLSLIIDEPVDKKKTNWGIENLPNLDFKFVCVNTLIGLPEMIEDSLGTSADDFEKLKQLRTEFFTASAKRKLQIEKDFKLLQNTIAEKQREWSTKNTQAVTMLVNWNPFDISETPWFDPFWMFGIKNGFNIVIANPPFVEHKKLKSFRESIKNQSYITHSGSADLYVYFYERSIKLLKEKGILTFISSNKFFKTNYGSRLRNYLSEYQTISIVDFSDYHVFDALVASCVYVLRKDKRSSEFVFVNIKEEFQDQYIYAYLAENKVLYPENLLKEKYWQFDEAVNYSLKLLIENVGKTIKSVRSIAVNRGVTTGRNDVFIIPPEIKEEMILLEPKSSEIIKPLLQGRNIKKWCYKSTNDYLIFTKKGINIDDYVTIKKYLSDYYEKLAPGIGRKPGDYKWYEIQDNTAYYQNFEKEKIIWGLTADKWAFAYDDEKHYLPSNGYILTSSEISVKYILGLLNSSLMQFYFRFIGIMTAGGAYTLKHQTINELPLKIPSNFESGVITNLVDYILFTKKNSDKLKGYYRAEDLGIDELKVQLFEEVLNGCVFELYFPDEMKSKDINILKIIDEKLVPISSMSERDAWKTINIFYTSIKEPDDVIRNRLLKFETRSPKILLPIINSLK